MRIKGKEAVIGKFSGLVNIQLIPVQDYI